MLVDIVCGTEVNLGEKFTIKSDLCLEFLYANRGGSLRINEINYPIVEWEVGDSAAVKVPNSIADMLGWCICNNIDN